MLIPFDQLFQRYDVKAKGVLHLGANTGQEADVYAALGIKRVIWVEALPDIYTQLVQKIARYPGSLAFCACLSNIDGYPVTFHRANNESQSSSFLEFGTHAQEHPTTRYIETIPMTTIRLDTLLKREGIIHQVEGGWFLNIDVQGAELLVLKGMGNLLSKFDCAYIEVNEKELYKGCPRVGEIDAHLSLYGLVGVECKMTSAGWGDKFYRKL